MCQQADKNRVSWVTDSRVVVQHANGSWSFQTGRQWGGPLRPAVTAGRRGGTCRRRARRPQAPAAPLHAGAGERVRTDIMRVHAYEKS